MKIVLLGPPGAGKGTLASSLKEKFGVVHISTGDMLRDEMRSVSNLGQQVKGFVESGKLVPDEVVIQVIKNRLKSDTKISQGYLLDGFPRTESQAQELDKILDNIEHPIDFALFMKATLPIIIQRLTGRRVCRECGALYHITNKQPKEGNKCDDCGGELYQRADDNEETIKTRMDEYMNNTKPVLKYYENRGKLRSIDSDKDSSQLLEQLMEVLEREKK